jgi:hypothetical protein
VADLTSAGTGAGGLGTSGARWAVTAVWGLGVISDVLGGSVALPFGLLGAVQLTTRGDDALSRRRAGAVAAASVISAVGALTSGAPLGHTWSFAFASYVAALLIPRGNVRSGLVAGSLIGLLGAGWAVWHGASASQYVDLLALPVLALFVGATWRAMLTRIVVRETTYRRDVERAAVAAEAAAAAESATQAELAQIGTEAEATLRRLHEGHILDEAFLAEISVVEASVRDQIRSPNLRDAGLRAAIERARRRGVEVTVLDSSTPQAPVVGALAERVAAVMDDLDSGTVTLRIMPRGRQGAVSVLRADERGHERLVLGADGGLVSRH